MRPLPAIAALAVALLPLHAPASPSFADRLAAILDGDHALARTHLSLRVLDLESGEVLFDRNGPRLFTPASVLKLYTSACALDTFGPNHTFTTSIAMAGILGEDVLTGDLVLIAGGDPMLTSGDLALLADRLVAETGIREVTGDLVVDASLFPVPLKGPGWMWDDDPDTYNMSISAMMVDYNVLGVVAEPGTVAGEPPLVRLDPPAAYPPVENTARLIVESPAELTVTRRPFTDTVLVSGTLSLGSEPVRTSLTMHDPARWAGSVFRAMLEDRGVAVGGEVRVSTVPVLEGDDPLVSFESRPLSDAITRFNKVSENAIGEMLLHHLALESGERPDSWQPGAQAITDWLTTTVGIDGGSFRLVDGSGLSRYNLVPPDVTTTLLAYMHGHEHFPVYRASLPVYTAVLGTGNEVERIYAKPGGMSGVSTLAGYVETLEGRYLAFAYFANGYVGSNAAVRELRERIFSELVEYAPPAE